MSDTTSTYRVRSTVRFRIIDFEAVVVRQDSAEVMVLNEVGARVLVLLSEGMSLTQIARRLPDEFQVSPEEAGQDVPRYIGELLEAGIIEPALSAKNARAE